MENQGAVVIVVDAAFAAATFGAIGPRAAAVARAIFVNGDRSGDNSPNRNDNVE